MTTTLSTPRVASPHSTQQLTCEIASDREVVTIIVRGELDMATAPQLDAALRDLRSVGFTAVCVDLRELEFIGVAGVSLVRRWRQLADLEGFTVCVRAADGPVRKVFASTGLAALLR